MVSIEVPRNIQNTSTNPEVKKRQKTLTYAFTISSDIRCYIQCWSESGLLSPTVSPSPQGQSPSPSPSPSGQSPSPSGMSPSPLDQSPSPSPSPLDQSPSPSLSPVGQSPSPSPRVQQKSEWVRTWVRTQPGLMSPIIAKCFILTLLFNHFCWAPRRTHLENGYGDVRPVRPPFHALSAVPKTSISACFSSLRPLFKKNHKFYKVCHLKA